MITCDCGCGTTDEGCLVNWFTLKRKNRSYQKPRIEVTSPLHFAKLECLSTWSSKATTTENKMEEYLKSDDYEGRHFDGWSFSDHDDSMRHLVSPAQ